MNAQQLKNAILQEAITGRLVPQYPNDEPASVLLGRIRKEKAKLVKEGKLKRKDLDEKPINKEEIPFEIPESWEWCRFGEMFNVRSAKRIHQSDWIKSGIPFFRGRELVQLIKTGSVESEVCISQELYDSLKVYGLPAKDDILISAVGTIGRVYVVKGTKPFYYKDAYILCCENIGKIQPDYIAIALTAPFLQKLIHQDSMATTVAQLTIEKAKKLLIPLPPLAEQHRIVAKIEELLPKVEEYGKAQEALDKLNAELPERLKKSILQEAITGKLVPQDPNDEPASVLLDKIRKEKAKLVKEGKLKKKDLIETPINKDEIPFEIPESWEWCRLSTLYNFIDYRGSTPNKINSGIPLVTAKNVKKGYNDYSIKEFISLEEYNKRKNRGVSKRGDLLFTTEAPLGNVSIADLDVYSAGQRLITLQSFDNYIIINKVIMFFMLADSFQKSLLEKKTGTTVAGIKASKLKDVLIPLPPLAEQHRIVAKIEELLTKIDKLKTK